jgi:hypothetical protein
MYANGEGVPRDDADAVRWLRKAADQGYAAAQSNLGAMYAERRGVQLDGYQAIEPPAKIAEIVRRDRPSPAAESPAPETPEASPTPSVADVGTKPPLPITTLPSSAKGYSWWSGWNSYAECMDYYTKNPPIPSFPFYEHYHQSNTVSIIKRPMLEKKAEEDEARRGRQQRLRTIWLSCRASSVSEEQAAACYALATGR